MISHQKQQINLPDYVPLLQSADILKTAEYRQNLVDQNLSTLKDTVDSYSKLRSYMLNDNARNYFDQEFKKLTSTIRDSAGLDFSNKGNLANVLAIGKPFENDKYIANGLKWGKEKERRIMELSNVDDEMRNSDNDLVFMNDIYEYEREGGLDSKVNTQKSYTPYVDVTEEVLKMEKEIQGEMKIELEKVKGNPGLLQQLNIEEKTADAVRRRIENLSPELQQQINIHAQAEMIRLGKENTYKIVKETQLSQLNSADAEINKGQASLRYLKGLKQTDQVKSMIEITEEALRNFTQQKRVLEEEIQQPADQYDPNQYLGIFRNRFLNGLAEKAAYKKTKAELRDDKVYLQNLEHSQKLSEMKANLQNQIVLEEMKDLINNTTLGTNTRIAIRDPKVLEDLTGVSLDRPVGYQNDDYEWVDTISEVKDKLKEVTGEKEKAYAVRAIAQLERLESVINSADDDDILDFGAEAAASRGKSVQSLLVPKSRLYTVNLSDILRLGYIGVRKPVNSSKEAEITPEEEDEKKVGQILKLQEQGLLLDSAQNYAPIRRMNENLKK